jgi:putative signal transducing protein
MNQLRPAPLLVGAATIGRMAELLRSNDPVLISFATSLLEDAEIEHTVLDSHMSVIDGSINAITNRILVADDRIDEARSILADAGVALETS